jgi:hypothetical protein
MKCWSLALLLLLAGCLLPPTPDRPGEPDDDDAVADDDDDAGDDDDLGDSPAATGLCAAAGRSTSSTWTSVTCTGPVDFAPGTASNSSYTVQMGTLAFVPEED